MFFQYWLLWKIMIFMDGSYSYQWYFLLGSFSCELFWILFGHGRLRWMIWTWFSHHQFSLNWGVWCCCLLVFALDNFCKMIQSRFLISLKLEMALFGFVVDLVSILARRWTALIQTFKSLIVPTRDCEGPPKLGVLSKKRFLSAFKGASLFG